MLANIQSKVADMDHRIGIHGKRFEKFKVIVEGLARTVKASCAGGTGEKERDEIARLSIRIRVLEDLLQDTLWSSSLDRVVAESTDASATPLRALEEVSLDIQERIRLLELRVGGVGVSMGSFMFQSFEDLLLWTKSKVPKGRFGLMLDGHSLLEYFSYMNHFDKETGLTAMHNSTKTGFHTMHEARVATSMLDYPEAMQMARNCLTEAK